MGNAKKRRKVARLLKERGLGRLYTGSKIAVYRHMARTKHLDSLMKQLSYEPGDIVQDCDGFNHRIKGYRSCWQSLAKRTLLKRSDQFIFDDGRFSCGCGWVGEPETPEKIRREFLEYWQEVVLSGDDTWVSKEPDSAYRRWRRGDDWEVCDENGFRLKK